MTTIRVTITRTAGSAPRDAGTQMLVRETESEGTIGGGALEWEAIRKARAMLAAGQSRHSETYALGPGLGQCCGGSVTLEYAVADSLELPEGRPLWIYGAGHVGRALVSVLAPLPDTAITWVDTAPARFPEAIPLDVTRLVAADMAAVVPYAPAHADHLIMTYSHDIDLALCHAILSQPFGTAGLIGSATKWARFKRRLAAQGHRPEQIARIACPIGKPSLGKHPQALAIGVAAVMLRSRDYLLDKGAG